MDGQLRKLSRLYTHTHTHTQVCCHGWTAEQALSPFAPLTPDPFKVLVSHTLNSKPSTLNPKPHKP